MEEGGIGIKYYVLVGTFVENHPTGDSLQKVMTEHLAYLKIGFDNDSVLLAGPLTDGIGGMAIVKSEDIQKFCNDDPIVKQGIQQYRVFEFFANDYLDCLKQWVADVAGE